MLSQGRSYASFSLAISSFSCRVPSIYVGDADALYEQALAAGAKSLWPPAVQSYDNGVGGVEDSIGNQWFIARQA